MADCGNPFTSGDAIKVADFGRQLAHTHALEPQAAAEQFFKLVLDCGLDPDDARTVRDSVKRIR